MLISHHILFLKVYIYICHKNKNPLKYTHILFQSKSFPCSFFRKFINMNVNKLHNFFKFVIESLDSFSSFQNINKPRNHIFWLYFSFYYAQQSIINHLYQCVTNHRVIEISTHDITKKKFTRLYFRKTILYINAITWLNKMRQQKLLV